MRVLVLTTVYQQILRELYQTRPELARASHQEQYRAVCDVGFGLVGFQRDNLEKLGHTAVELIVDSGEQQRAWMREHADLRGRLATVAPVLAGLARRALGRRTPAWLAKLAGSLPMR